MEKKKLKLMEFCQFSFKEKEEYIHKHGTEIIQRTQGCRYGEGKVLAVLYRVHDFYVQEWIFLVSGETYRLFPFTDERLLEPFLDTIDINLLMK